MGTMDRGGEAPNVRVIRAYNRVIRAKSERDDGATAVSQEAFLRELMALGPEERDAFIEQLRQLNAE